MGTHNQGRSFQASLPASHEGNTNTWFTPKWITKNLGLFDLDPCTQTYRPHDIALKSICEDMDKCGLSEQWHGRVWMNPPYGKMIGAWLDKLAAHGNGIALVFSSTDTNWCQKAFSCADAVNFIDKRIRFIQEDGTLGGSPARGSILLAYGAANIEYIKNVSGTTLLLK